MPLPNTLITIVTRVNHAQETVNLANCKLIVPSVLLATLEEFVQAPVPISAFDAVNYQVSVFNANVVTMGTNVTNARQTVYLATIMVSAMHAKTGIPVSTVLNVQKNVYLAVITVNVQDAKLDIPVSGVQNVQQTV